MGIEIQQFIDKLSSTTPELSSVWLIGSRANGTFTHDSDWDFVVFGSEETLAFLKSTVKFHRPLTDFLVVTNGEDFQAAWGEEEKTGSLTGWEWKQLTEDDAEYTQSKWVEAEDGAGVKLTRRRAIRVWPV